MFKILFFFGMFSFISTQEAVADAPDPTLYWGTLQECLTNIKILYGNEITAILVIVIISLLVLIAKDEAARRNLTALKSARRISVEEYERAKRDNTKAAVEELERSEQYQKLKKQFEAGEWQRTELTEEEKIELSDDDEE